MHVSLGGEGEVSSESCEQLFAKHACCRELSRGKGGVQCVHLLYIVEPFIKDTFEGA